MVGCVSSKGVFKVMVISIWPRLFVLHVVLYLLSSVEARSSVYGDVRDNEVAIDSLRYIQPSQDKINRFFKQVPNKIDFAVPPHDPRFYMPSEVFKEEPKIEERYPSQSNQHPNHPNNHPLNTHYDYNEGYYNDYNAYDNLDREYYRDIIPDEFGKGPHLVYDPYESARARQSPYTGFDVHRFYKDHHNGNVPQDNEISNDIVPASGVHAVIPPTADKLPQAKPSSANVDKVNYLHHSKSNVQQPYYVTKNQKKGAGTKSAMSDFKFIAVVSGFTAAAVCAVFGAGICYFRLHKNKREAAAADYPAYGVTGPSKDLSPGAADRKMAQSAHMFHYQHQKQQMIALEKSSGDDRHCSASDIDSEEDGEEGDYTVYECPGLAPTGEMEVKNPLFNDDTTPATPQLKGGTNESRRGQDSDDDED